MCTHEHLGRLALGESLDALALDDAPAPRIDRGESRQRFLHCREGVCAFVERGRLLASASSIVMARSHRPAYRRDGAAMIHELAPHRTRLGVNAQVQRHANIMTGERSELPEFTSGSYSTSLTLMIYAAQLTPN